MTNTKETANLGKWGRLHYDYLYRNKRTVINAMRLKGTLGAYLEQFEDLSVLIPKDHVRGSCSPFPTPNTGTNLRAPSPQVWGNSFCRYCLGETPNCARKTLEK